jgi:hypothetical protein
LAAVAPPATSAADSTATAAIRVFKVTPRDGPDWACGERLTRAAPEFPEMPVSSR